MDETKALKGHGAAILTILIWGTTFISTKVLLTALTPVEILYIRFIMGYLALWCVCPRRLMGTTRQQELTFMAAGLTGICLYYLLENIGLTYSFASHIAVILSISPFFTAILARIVLRQPLNGWFFVGFLLAISGIALISYDGTSLAISPVGDILALLAALVWAIYSLLTRQIGTYGYTTILVVRRIFGYGILWMIPAAAYTGVEVPWQLAGEPVLIGNLLFLGLGASALCFVTWSLAVQNIGVVKTSIYIYAVPVITVAASVVILHEPLTALLAGGTALTLAGLGLSSKTGT